MKTTPARAGTQPGVEVPRVSPEAEEIWESSAYFRNPEVSNRVLKSHVNPRLPSLVFAPGWGTLPEHWQHVSRSLAQRCNLFWFETREKKHTRFHVPRPDFKFDSHSSDLIHFLNAQPQPYHLVCASVSASALINGWGQLKNLPASLTLITPILRFRAPKFFSVLNAVPRFLIPLLLPAGLKVIRLTHYGRDNSRLELLLDGLNAKEIDHLRSSVMALKHLELPDSSPGKVNVPTQVIVSREEGLHSANESESIASRIPNARIHHFDSFGQVHSRLCAAHILQWIHLHTPQLN